MICGIDRRKRMDKNWEMTVKSQIERRKRINNNHEVSEELDRETEENGLESSADRKE